MKHVTWLLFCSLIGICMSSNVYVSDREGDDEGTGNFNHPFKTIQKAIREGRRLRRNGAKDVTIYLRGGVYVENEYLNLFKQDSYTTFTNYKNEEVTISGSIVIEKERFEVIRENQDIKVYKATYKGKCSENTFVGNRRLVRARKPNLAQWTGENMSGEGPYLRVAGLLKTTPTCTYESKGRFRQECDKRNKMGFVYAYGDMSADWTPSIKSSQGVDIIVFHAWTAERGTVRQIIPQNNTVLFRKPLRKTIGGHPFSSGYRYIVENVESELDAPGEFFCKSNGEESELLFALPHNEVLADTVYVGNRDKIFIMKGVTHVAFKGISFKYTDNVGFHGYNQAKAALMFDKCSYVNITNCSFHHMGYTGIYTKNTNYIKISKNDFKDIAYIGIAVDYNNQPDSKFATKNVIVTYNTMNGCGVTNMFQPSCIHVRGAANIRVAWNSVQRISYAGIRIGWQKAFQTEYVKQGEYVFYVDHNHVHDYGLGILNDFGGIYLSTNIADCKDKQDMSICNLHALITNNVVNSGKGYLYGGSGIYGDTSSSALTVQGNWLYNLSDAAVVFHCGKRNLAKNNVFKDIDSKRVIGTCNPVVAKEDGSMPEQQFTIDGNIFYVVNENLKIWKSFDVWKDLVPRFKNNLYYFATDSLEQRQTFFPKGKNYLEWWSHGEQDAGSIYGEDPMFVDVGSDNFNLRPESPMSHLPIYHLNLTLVQDL